MLEFENRRGLEREIERLRRKTKSAIIPGYTKPIQSLKKELGLYFKGELKAFNTPLIILGSAFQKLGWAELVHCNTFIDHLWRAKAPGFADRKSACIN